MVSKLPKEMLGDINKSVVGLNNVDNTSDVNKPVSTSIQQALNTKESTNQKGAANGYASLNVDQLVPLTNLPATKMRSAFDFIAKSKWAAITAGTLSGNLNAEFVAIDASGENIFFPKGVYPISQTSDYSIFVNTNGVTWDGAGIGLTIFKNITPNAPARPLVLTTGTDITLSNIEFQARAHGMTQPTIAGGSIPLGSAIVIMGDRTQIVDCAGSEAWDNGFAIGKFNLVNGDFTRGSPSDCRIIRSVFHSAGRGIQTMYGPGVPAVQNFQSGAGFNNLCGGRSLMVDCKDYFSTTGFGLDYAGGAQGDYVNCVSYGNKRDSVGTYADLNATPGGQGFYVGSRGSLINCSVFDNEGDGIWVDAAAFDCIIVGFRSRGAQKHGALIQGYNHRVELLVEDPSQAGLNMFPAVTVRGGRYEGGSLYSDSTDIVVDVQTRGDKHSYGVDIEQGTFKVTGMVTGNWQGNLAPIRNADTARVLAVGKSALGGAAQSLIGKSVVTSANQSYLSQAFGDSGANGSLFVQDFNNPNKRLAVGYDPVLDAVVLQAIHAGTAPKDIYMNPSGGNTWVYIPTVGPRKIETGAPDSAGWVSYIKDC